MTIVDETRYTDTDTTIRHGAYAVHDRNAPYFGVRDVAAGIVTAVMILGPLLAGVITHS